MQGHSAVKSTQAKGPLIIRVNMILVELESGEVSQLFTALLCVRRSVKENQREVSWLSKPQVTVNM